ncbi:hypothetical protein INS49_011933 [Diaporthe citri]|uniref:uncharacterized protein n=1 Tax=Diaporthe citri TaxID=83186 RepID=UPI001C81B938|nr:uncharacterized protein INS49_011933 [Diaporthe citri]KAG6360866.1 hypothetical protein INS49_011933 [Diaporthe citri]
MSSPTGLSNTIVVQDVLIFDGKEFTENGFAETLISAWPRLASADEASAFVQSQIDESGASHIKLMHELGDTLSMPDLPRPRLDIQKAVVDAAHERGIIAVGHALSHEGAFDLLAAGVDGLAHCFLDKPPNDEWIKTMKEKGTHCNPTLSLCASQTGQGAELQRRFADGPLARRMLLGPRPEEALRSATSLTAERFGFTDRGTIESGRLADLVLLEGDGRTVLADEDVLCLPVSLVWREGILADVFSTLV